MPAPEPPLADSYPAKVAMVILALCPYIVVTTASTLMDQPVMRDLHTSKTALEMAGGLANAGYAFGAVLAALMAKRFSARPLLLVYEAAFVAGSVLVATAPDLACFTAGRVAEGVATGLMLVAALPPLVTGFGAGRLPVSAAVVDIGLFGATTIGPLVGGDVGAHGSWRLLFWVLAALGLIGFALEAAAVPHSEPLDPGAPADVPGLVLALAATSLPFIGASLLTSEPVVSWQVLPFLVAGGIALAGLVVFEYRREGAVTPVKMLAHSLPVTGVLVAMFTGAAAVALLDLAEELVMQGMHASPVLTGELFWPQVAGVALASVLFGAVFATRFTTTLIVTGIGVLGAGAVARAGPAARVPRPGVGPATAGPRDLGGRLDGGCGPPRRAGRHGRSVASQRRPFTTAGPARLARRR